MHVSFSDAVAIVRDLAHENVLDECATLDSGLDEERKLQEAAVELMDDFLDLLRGHHL